MKRNRGAVQMSYEVYRGREENKTVILVLYGEEDKRYRYVKGPSFLENFGETTGQVNQI